jgi:hypothetical protein
MIEKFCDLARNLYGDEFIPLHRPVFEGNEMLNIVDMNSKERKTIGENGKKWIYSNRKYSTLAQKYIEAIETTKPIKSIKA